MSATAGSRAGRDNDVPHNTTRHASGRLSRRPVPGRHTAIAPSGNSHDDCNATAAEGAGAGVVVVGGAGNYGTTYRFGVQKRLSYLNHQSTATAAAVAVKIFKDLQQRLRTD